MKNICFFFFNFGQLAMFRTHSWLCTQRLKLLGLGESHGCMGSNLGKSYAKQVPWYPVLCILEVSWKLVSQRASRVFICETCAPPNFCGLAYISFEHRISLWSQVMNFHSSVYRACLWILELLEV